MRDTITLISDTTPPTGAIEINKGAVYANATSVELSILGVDTETCVIEMQFSNDNITYSDPEDYCCSPRAPAGYDTLKSWTLTPGDGVKTVYVKFKDAAGNQSDAISDIITLDTTPPAGEIVINWGFEYTPLISVILNLSAADAGSGMGSGAEVQFSNDGTSWSTPEAYAEIKPWTLTSGDGEKTVYAKFKDAAGNQSDAVSDSIILDTTPPVTPTVTDDGDCTASTTQLHASWSSSDPESGIVEYLYAIGATRGGTDVIGWTHTTASSVTKTGLTLTNNKVYYFSVRAKNSEELWSSVGYSDGIKVDTTSPVVPVVTDSGVYTTSATRLYARWTSRDLQSGIGEYQYAIGTSQGAVDVIGWTSAGTAVSVTKTGLSLVLGQTYYFSVKAKNKAGSWSETGYSDGIKVDTTPPTVPIVTDDGAYATSATKLHARWTSRDLQSGISEYQYAIGTSPGAVDTVDWTSTGTVTAVTKTGLSLELGQTYYFSVKAKNKAGSWSETGYSDGIKMVLP